MQQSEVAAVVRSESVIFSKIPRIIVSGSVATRGMSLKQVTSHVHTKELSNVEEDLP